MGTRRARSKDTWQAQKSAQTRQSILEATVRCYVNLGYHHTTIGTIVKESSLSRGAVNHHFDSLFDLVRSAANYIKEKRVEDFENAFLPVARASDPDRMRKGLEVYWKWLQTDYAIAYRELLSVSRTDTALQEVMIPIKKAFEQSYRDLIAQGYPQLLDRPEILTVTEDITQYLLNGMASDHQLKKGGKGVRDVMHSIEEWLTFVWYQE